MTTLHPLRPPRQDREATITERVGERPGLSLGRLREASLRELGVRFGAGALTSVLSGLLGLLISPRIGGIMLAFPAILAASLTLIEEQEDSEEAREDARGAVAGALALAGFALLAWLLLGHLAAGLVLLCAVAVWLVLAVSLYVLLWLR